ncbi:MAG: glycosyltransferase family 2 protein [Cyclobacteriaceae bacterium]|nr:glycosyltransferase family 2 protein [Cyclobacteriaceae bacterium]
MLVIVYFIYFVGYFFVFALAGRLYKEPALKQGSKKKFVVLIPAYKEDAVIISVGKKALTQSYPQELYDVVIIADSLQPETISELRQLPLTVIEVHFDKSTKVKSLNFAIGQITKEYDYAIILDADNVMYSDFIERLNDHHYANRQAIQGQRVPKNKQNSLAFLDGLSEAINNHIYRQGTTALGLSASINGSGISIDFHMLKTILSGMNSVGGFDRELELLLLAQGQKVFYLKSAKVFDEKVQVDSVFENQRKRWISSQYIYLAKYFKPGMLMLLKGDFTYFNSAILRNIQLPRLINIGLLFLFTLFFTLLPIDLVIPPVTWLMLGCGLIAALLLSIPDEYYTIDLMKSIFKIPGIFFKMLLILFRLRDANKKFIHTPHFETKIDTENKIK